MSSKDTPPEGVSERFLHYMQNPLNIGKMPDPSGKARMTGQCGDSIGVHVSIENEVLEKIWVQPDGCAYTLVCAEAMSRLAQGLTVEKALELEPEDIAKEVGGLPEDHLHCARLALNSLGEAVADCYAELRAKEQK
ncbi:iron-sulfur cluster assembly scaffold protein [uncultured Pseudodesulfovibrio sp.]|uniref:iron-sulfur cluster assembly scaffold protein n=1 Tax=uncultured Pseudodesulfovibrio sp. TaxID=2035858 RepID=UPI0029C84C84|nr:iron-sulfur cluster assembly scaffold protein [uncultured Pseudodesulfovibrio sp.]